MELIQKDNLNTSETLTYCVFIVSYLLPDYW